MNPILEIRNLSKRYPGFALNNLNISLDSGYIMGFIGPNGAGKTTTIKLIMNLIRRDGGEIKVCGLDNIRDEIRVKEKIGFAYEENYFYDELTLLETRRVIAPFYPGWDDAIFRNYLDRFELPANKKVKDLSRGMKMKLSLAVALSHNADLIILDEPTSGLDPIFRNELLEILREIIQDERKGVFFSTHITTDLDRTADYITFLHRGKIVFSEARDSLLERYVVVKGGRELLDRDVRREFIGIRENRFGFEALTGDVQRARQILGSSVIFERASLEDIMLYTIRGDRSV